MVPGVGVEPTRPEGQGILSPPRMPFRHPGEQQRWLAYHEAIIRPGASTEAEPAGSDELNGVGLFTAVARVQASAAAAISAIHRARMAC
jgi:hypothetical protein